MAIIGEIMYNIIKTVVFIIGIPCVMIYSVYVWTKTFIQTWINN